MFAYSFFPVLIINGLTQHLPLQMLKPDPLPSGWEKLGYDPVTFNGLTPEENQFLKCFSHSPLSPFCNGRCHDIAVNRYCLLDTEEEGLARAVEFSQGGGEPEPYVLVEVWRQPS